MQKRWRTFWTSERVWCVCVCVCVCVCNDIGLERTIPISGSLKHYLEDRGGVQWIWKQKKSEIVLLMLGQETWIFKILDSSLLRDVWASQVMLVVKNPPANAGNAGDMGLIPRSGRSPGVGNGNTLQYSCLGNSWTEEPGGLWSKAAKSHSWLSIHSRDV